MHNPMFDKLRAAAKGEQADQPQPNRAQRRAREKAMKGQQRRGQKHFDRQRRMADTERQEAQRALLRNGDAFVAYWNGLPTFGIRGTAIVAPAPEFPEYWAEDLIGQRIKVVAVNLDGVNFGGGTIFLDDRTGGAYAKVTEGMGSPRIGHASIEIEPESFKPARVQVLKKKGA